MLFRSIIKGENIPEPGVPESFKVLLKEMQSLGLDVQVQREDGTEVEMTESIDYGDTELRAMLEGDRHYNDRESYSNYGYQEQEFKNKLYAESLAKSNGNMNQALNALQKIEKRAYGKANTTTTDRASFIKAVQKERRLEIALQGERLFELKRIKQSVRGEAWDSHKVMFQIPDVEQNGNPDVNMN